MRDWTTKDFRKAAFAVGTGFTVGKYVGKCVNAAIGGAVTGTVKYFASKGNSFAQELCERTKIEYESRSKENKDEAELKIGFHCE